MSEKTAEDRLAEYREASTLPLLVAGFLYIAALVVSLIHPEPFTKYLILLTWGAFVIDYCIQLWLAPVKWRFIGRHIPYLIALVFPPLRMYLLLVFSYRLFINKNSNLRDRVGLAAGFAVVVIVVFGALLTFFFEEQEPGANIKSYGEALWWAAVTVTTVGYGDYAPVTAAGRVVGTLVFSTGVAAIAVLTATVIGVFTDSAKYRKKARNVESSARDDAKEELLSKLDEINGRLIRLEHAHNTNPGAAARKLSAPRRRVVATVHKESSPGESAESHPSPEESGSPAPLHGESVAPGGNTTSEEAGPSGDEPGTLSTRDSSGLQPEVPDFGRTDSDNG